MGFTLIEILLVLGIIAGTIAIGFSRIQKKENNIKNVARSFVVLSREIRNHARLKNSSFRLVVEFDDKKPRYWVEKASGLELRDPKAHEKKDEDEDQAKSSFTLYKTLMKKEKELPLGLFFASLETAGQEPIKEGQAAIYFSPEGFVDASALQITDRKKTTWTLVFNPLTGQADIVPEAQTLKGMSR